MNRLKLILVGLLFTLSFAPLFLWGTRAANDFPYVNKDVVDMGFNLPQVWSTRGGNGLGENIAFTLWSYPIDFLFGIGSTLGLDFGSLTKVLFLIPTLAIGVFSINKLLKSLKIEGDARLIGISLYMLNSYFLLLLDGGQLSVALAYSLMPFAYVSFVEGLNGNTKLKARSAIVSLILGVIDLRFLYLHFLILVLKLLLDLFFSDGDYKKILKKWTYSLGLFVVLFLSANVYWIVPFLTMGTSGVPKTLLDINQISAINFTYLHNAVSMSHPNWPINSFGNITPPKWQFYFIFIGVLAFLYRKKISKDQLFFLLLFIVGAFLAKGGNPPLEGVYGFLFQHLPGFFMFRDSTKFFTIISLAVSVLVSFAYVKKRGLFFLFILYIFLLVSPIWRSKMTGFFSPQPNEQAYASVTQKISNDKNFGRVLWLPMRPPLGFSSALHPSLDGLILANKRPFNMANVGSYERFNFIRDSSYAEDLLEIAGVSYVAYPFPDVRRTSLSNDDLLYYDLYSKQISNKDWVREIISEPNITVLKTRKTPEMFSISNRLWWVLGPDTIYKDLKQISGFSLIANPIVFVEGTPGIVQKFQEEQFGKIIMYDRNENDLVASFYTSNDYFSLTSLTKINGNNLWQTDTNSTKWREFLQEKYTLENNDFSTENAMVSEGGGIYQLNTGANRGTYLFLRVFVSSKGGSIEVSGAGEQIINTLDTSPDSFAWGIPESRGGIRNYDKAGFHWFIVPLKDSSSINLIMEGELNAISGAFVSSEENLANVQKNIDLLNKEGKIIDFKNLSFDKKQDFFGNSKNLSVPFKTKSQTAHTVDLQKLDGTYALIFSQTYDPGWRLNGKPSLPLFALSNGFIIRAGSVNELSYTPQQNVFPALMVLGLIVLVIFVSLSL